MGAPDDQQGPARATKWHPAAVISAALALLNGFSVFVLGGIGSKEWVSVLLGLAAVVIGIGAAAQIRRSRGASLAMVLAVIGVLLGAASAGYVVVMFMRWIAGMSGWR